MVITGSSWISNASSWVTVTTVLIGTMGGVGGLAAFGQAFFGRSKVRADAAGILTGSALEIVRQIQEREGRLQGRVRELEDEIDLLHRRMRELERSLADREAVIMSLQRQGEDSESV